MAQHGAYSSQVSAEKALLMAVITARAARLYSRVDGAGYINVPVRRGDHYLPVSG